MGGAKARGDLVFYVGSSVGLARMAGFLMTGGLSAVVSTDGLHGNRCSELRVRADEVSKAVLQG